MANSLRKMSSIYEKLLFFPTNWHIDWWRWVCMPTFKQNIHPPPPIDLAAVSPPVAFLPSPAFTFNRCKFTLTTKACHTDPDMCKMFLSTCDWSRNRCNSAGSRESQKHIKRWRNFFFFFLKIVTVEAAWAQREKNISPVSAQAKSKNTSVMVSGLCC